MFTTLAETFNALVPFSSCFIMFPICCFLRDNHQKLEHLLCFYSTSAEHVLKLLIAAFFEFMSKEHIYVRYILMLEYACSKIHLNFRVEIILSKFKAFLC